MLKNLSFKNIVINPVMLFMVFTIILTFILLFKVGFHIPNYYIDMNAADKIARTVKANAVEEAVKHLENHSYLFDNILFQLWGWCSSLFIFTMIFKVKSFKDFYGNLPLFKNKIFIYIWINISYVIYSACFIMTNMIDLEKYVYNSGADSMGIPLFYMTGLMTMIGFLYYPLVNILFILTYNTRLKSRFLDFMFILAFLPVLFSMVLSFMIHFSYLQLVNIIIYIISFTLILSSLKYLRSKRLNFDKNISIK